MPVTRDEAKQGSVAFGAYARYMVEHQEGRL
jgi:hypothetical protein